MAQTAEATLKMETSETAVSAESAGNAILTLAEAACSFRQERQENRRFVQKVRPPREGSFIIVFEFHILDDGDGPLLLPEHPLISRYYQILREFFDWKVKLIGTVPEVIAGSSVMFEGQARPIDPITARFLDPESAVSRFAAQTFHDIQADPSIGALSLFRGDLPDPYIRVERASYPAFETESVQLRVAEGRRVTRRMELVVEAPVLTGRSIQWRFIQEGRVIGAKISDEAFLARVTRSSEQFSNGDRLEATVEINQQYSGLTDTWIDQRYTVLEVHRHIPFRRGQTKGLFGNGGKNSVGE